MKALIISDDDFIISQSSKFLHNNNFDIIIYKWLLKALDNIEEIQPDLIFINASEYPRHWKTLVQFVKSGIGGERVCIILYESKALSEEDNEKAKALGINATLKNFSKNEIEKTSEIISAFFGIENKTDSKKTIPTEETFTQINKNYDEIPTVEDIFNENNILVPKLSEGEDVIEEILFPHTEEKKQRNAYIIFNNPKNYKLNTGIVTKYDDSIFECHFDFPLENLSENEIIRQISFLNDDGYFGFSATVKSVENESGKLTLKILEKYEEI